MTDAPPRHRTMGEAYADIGPGSEFSRRKRAALVHVARCRTDRLVALAREYDRQWAKQTPDSIDESLYQIRQLLSDALRDEGCEDEDAHDLVLNGWGLIVVDAILEQNDDQ